MKGAGRLTEAEVRELLAGISCEQFSSSILAGLSKPLKQAENSAVWTAGHGKKLRSLRKARGLTLYKLSRASDVEPSIIWKYEMGHTKRPGAVILLRLAEALGTSIENLMKADAVQPAVKQASRKSPRRAAASAGVG